MSNEVPPEITLALPCYNENLLIAEVVRSSVVALARLGRTWEILVIDNHSDDGTPERVRELARSEPRVRLVVHDTNRFYSGSCRTALAEARGRFVAIMDSDGQFTADDLPRFLEALEAGSNFVLGWRRVRHDPWPRKFMSTIFNFLAYFYVGFHLHDLNVGIRMFDRKFIEVAEIRHSLNLANPELYVCARRSSLVVTEVPVTHAARDRGQSCHDFSQLLGLFLQVNRYLSDLRKQLNSGPVAVNRQ